MDPPLSPEGVRQVAQIAGGIAPGSLQLVWSSPLQRARALAEAMAQSAGCSVVIDERLTEMAMGVWEGLHRQEIEAQYPDLYAAWYQRPDTVQFPGGERLRDVSDRMVSFLDDAFSSGAPSRAAVVSHDSVVRIAVMKALGLGLDRLHAFRMRNGSVSVLHGHAWDASVESVDVTAHLTGSPFVLPS